MSRVVVTGACGFIGSCLCRSLLQEGHEVVGIDNLFRPGSEHNAKELCERGMAFHRADLGVQEKTFHAFGQIGPVEAVFHLAAQVAVTTSYRRPAIDFLDNGVASFNVIEAVRRFTPDAYCLYASTNKVYGHIEVCEPVGLSHPLNPYTPYGVSKAVGEMYFTEYGRKEIGLATCSLRQSCIYGHHQYGLEDQGWVAWFAIANLLEQPITIYGDGKQIRDLLFVDDLINLYLKCWRHRQTGVYPAGGGAGNTSNLLNMLERIQDVTGKAFAEIRYDAERPGDQPYFVADLAWVEGTSLEWRPETSLNAGLPKMVDWIDTHLDQIKTFRFL